MSSSTVAVTVPAGMCTLLAGEWRMTVCWVAKLLLGVGLTLRSLSCKTGEAIRSCYCSCMDYFVCLVVSIHAHSQHILFLQVCKAHHLKAVKQETVLKNCTKAVVIILMII